MSNPRSCTVQEFKEDIDTGNAVILDVRTRPEYEARHVPGSERLPICQLKSNGAKFSNKAQKLYVLCEQGTRAQRAALTLVGHCDAELVIVEGGIRAWEAAGYPLVHEQQTVWSLERQVRFAAGLLVLTGAVLALTVDTRFAIVPVVVGLGFVYSAVSNSCMMAMALMNLPWNR